jgi:mannose-6-phosphate isomerase-like protein (cupin superfamily)
MEPPFSQESIRKIVESSDIPKVEMFPGFWRQTLVHSDGLMLCLFTWRKGASLPGHSHPHEQAGFVVKGTVELTIEGQAFVTSAGCSYFVPSNQVHSATALDDALVVDAFCPARSEYVLRPSPKSHAHDNGPNTDPVV